jgi:hypothetical protein
MLLGYLRVRARENGEEMVDVNERQGEIRGGLGEKLM